MAAVGNVSVSLSHVCVSGGKIYVMAVITPDGDDFFNYVDKEVENIYMRHWRIQRIVNV